MAKDNLIKDDELTSVSGGSGNGYCTYIVQAGDTLDFIAKKYGTTKNLLMLLNDISNPNAIRPGQKLTVPRI